jgi:predicted dehydrogenase
MIDTLACAIVGTGDVARLHAEAVIAHPHARLAAVTNKTRSKAEAFAEQWGDPAVYDTLEDLLAAEHPDVVIVCTPPSVHREQVLAAFATGAHVILEKPAALSLGELDDMRSAAVAAQRELAIVFQQRTGSAAAHVRHLLQSGSLGRPLLAQCQTLWYRDPAYFSVPWRGSWESEGGGTTLGHGIHQIDLLVYLLGDWTAVRAQLWRLDRDTQTEDASTATVVFEGGTVAQVVSSAVSPRQTSSLRIDTRRATITLDHLYGHGHSNWRITPAPEVPEAAAADWVFPDVEEPSGHAVLVRDVLDALVAGAQLPSIAADPLRSFELVTAMYASARSDGATVVPADLADPRLRRRGLESPVTDLRT